MSASLTPLRRFMPLRHTLRTGDAGDAPIPLPPPTINTPWPPRRGGAAFSLPALDHLEATVAAMDAGDRTRQPARTLLDQARAEGYDTGMRDGAQHRRWWDVLVGLTWGAALIALLLGALAVAGWVDVKVRVFGEAPPAAAAPAAAPATLPATTEWAAQT